MLYIDQFLLAGGGHGGEGAAPSHDDQVHCIAPATQNASSQRFYKFPPCTHQRNAQGGGGVMTPCPLSKEQGGGGDPCYGCSAFIWRLAFKLMKKWFFFAHESRMVSEGLCILLAHACKTLCKNVI